MRYLLALVALGSLNVNMAVPDPQNQAIIAGYVKYCAGVEPDLGVSRTLPTFVENVVGGTNYVEDLLFDPDCTSVSACWDKYQSTWINKVVVLGIPLIFAVLTLLMWLCMGGCACCRCCRRCGCCCCKEKAFPSYLSKGTLMFVWVSVAVFVVAAIIDAAFSASATTSTTAGSDTSLCRAFTITAGLLNGVNWTATPESGFSNETVTRLFLGLVPLETNMEGLTTVLEPSSTAVTNITETVETTVDLENAVARLEAYLDLTQDMLGDADTIQPGAGAYKCLACEACCGGGSDSYVTEVKTVVGESYASSINTLRSQIRDTLYGVALENTRSSLSSGSEIVQNATNTVENEIGQELVDNEDTIDKALNGIKIGAIVLTCSIAIPFIWIVVSLVVGVCKSYKLSYSDPDDKPINPCCVSCGWCWSMLVTLIVLLVGGALVIAGYVQSSLCDSAFDFDSFTDKALARYGSDLASNSTEVVMIDSCLKSYATGDFLSALQIGTNNASYYFDQITALNAMVDGVFNTTTTVPSIVGSAEFRALVDTLDAYKALYMIPADRIAEIKADSSLNPNAISEIQSQTGYGGSASCSAQVYDLTRTQVGAVAQASLRAAGFSLPPDVTAYSIGGIQEFEANIAPSTVSYSGTCTDLQVDMASYNPLSYLLFWQARVATNRTFKCSRIAETADPATGVISFDRVDGTCQSVAELDAYIADLAANLDLAAAAVDTSAASTKETIANKVLSTLVTEVLPPVTVIQSASDCRPLLNGWNALYNSLCDELTYGVMGLGITLSVYGGLGLLAVIVMFAIWRNLKDNITLWRDLVKERSDRMGATITNNVVPAVPGPSAVQIIPQSDEPRRSKRRG